MKTIEQMIYEDRKERSLKYKENVHLILWIFPLVIFLIFTTLVLVLS